MKQIVIALLIFLAVRYSTAFDGDTQPQKPEVGIDEKVGAQIPLDLSFLDEYGKPVTLRSLFTKPTVLMLVYYRCPGLCSPLMGGVADAVDHLDMEAGKDFNMVSISFDPTETYITASQKKSNYLADMKKKIPPDSWRFLTGDSVSIAKITSSVGFRFEKQGNDYMHGTAIMVVSPSGKVARYLFGIEFLPLDLKLAITEASEGISTPAVDKLLKLCYSYDPAGHKYILSITRITGAIILFMILVFALILLLIKKKHIPAPNGTGKGSINYGKWNIGSQSK